MIALLALGSLFWALQAFGVGADTFPHEAEVAGFAVMSFLLGLEVGERA